MSDYISREAILAKCAYEQPWGADAVIAMIEDFPASDVREVRRGRWITKPYMMGNTQYCSCCDENYGRKHNFCPNCGAQMEEQT